MEARLYNMHVTTGKKLQYSNIFQIYFAKNLSMSLNFLIVNIELLLYNILYKYWFSSTTTWFFNQIVFLNVCI